jgi:hypothetical protein
MQDIDPDAFFILNVTLYDHQHQNGYTEAYSISAEGQEEAFEIIEGICAEENVTASLINKVPKEETVSALVGPKRLEITLRPLNGSGEKRLVMTDLMPPSGHYKCYSVSGRAWTPGQKGLSTNVETTWGSSYWLSRIDAYLGGSAGSATDHFTPQNQEMAWASLEKMWYRFQEAEKRVIRNWTVMGPTTPAAAADDDVYGGEWYGPATHSQHWTQRTPSAYDTTPIVAFFRVRGDEVGAEIHKEQEDAWWAEHGGKDPAEMLVALLAPAEKKPKADSPQETSSGDGTPAADDVCAECGGAQCTDNYCIEALDLAAFGGQVVADGRYTIH